MGLNSSEKGIELRKKTHRAVKFLTQAFQKLKISKLHQ
jgi:hypothetical protein